MNTAALLLNLAKDCSEPNWDGYGANPVEHVTVARATSLLRSLPSEIAVPEVGADPDGSISLEWSRSPRNVLSLNVGLTDALAYAWLDGAERGHAVAIYEDGAFPERVLQQIRMIMV